MAVVQEGAIKRKSGQFDKRGRRGGGKSIQKQCAHGSETEPARKEAAINIRIRDKTADYADWTHTMGIVSTQPRKGADPGCRADSWDSRAGRPVICGGYF